MRKAGSNAAPAAEAAEHEAQTRGAAVQRSGGGGEPADVHAAAATGLQGSASQLPHLAAVQHSFGRHDVSGITARSGAAAASANAEMGSEAYATGNEVVFRDASPSLHTAAHEAAHVVQQRAGVSLKGGVGQAGDSYENHADAVADRVVQGQSAEDLLDQVAGGAAPSAGGGDRAVQHKTTKSYEVTKSARDGLRADSGYQRDQEIAGRTVNNRQTNSARRAEARVHAAENEAYRKDKSALTDFQKPALVNEVRKDIFDKTSVHSDKHDEEFLGGKAQGDYHLLSAEGKYGHNVTVDQTGAAGSVFATGMASLVSFKEELKWETGPFELAGESMNGKLFLLVLGWVGADAAVQLNARLKKYQPQPGMPQVDPEAITGGIDLGAGAAAEAFAGAKVVVIPGAAWEWNKKADSAYKDKLGQAANLLVDAVSVTNPPLGWILRQLGAEQAAEKILQWLFTDGSAKTVGGAALQALGVGTAGIGASVKADMGFKNGKLEWTLGASATFGLGVGGLFRLMLDPVEGIKFGLIVGGELMPKALDAARQQINQVVSSGVNLGKSFFAWLQADDKAREAVSSGAHKLLDAEQRGTMIDSMRRGVCSRGDEAAILEILEFSSQNGDASQVLDQLGGSEMAAKNLLWSFQGQAKVQLRALLEQMGVAVPGPKKKPAARAGRR